MRRILALLVLAACAHPAPPPAATAPAPAAAAPITLASLQPGGKVAGFSAEARYLDDTGKPMGARLRHVATGFELDLIFIDSVPQAFIWANTFSTSDMGEAHTQEHLLLGKGNKGRWVANVEEMALATSSAFTDPWRTCYFMNSPVPAAFWQVLEADLDGLLHPDYTDEEIAREVRNFGISAGPDGNLRLEEKGTVYNEMVRSYEQFDFLGWRKAEQLVYGAEHPLALSEGGWPEAIRRMTPADIRRYHHDHYHLGNMGMIVSLPPGSDLGQVLAKTGELLVRQGGGRTGHLYSEDELPPPKPAPAGQVEIVDFAATSASTPVPVQLVWPADRQLTARDHLLLSLFLDALAGDESTELYKLLVDSKTRVMDLGATGVGSSISDTRGAFVVLGVNDVQPNNITPARLAEVRTLVTGALGRIAAAAPGSPELVAFNARVLSRVIDRRRALVKFVSSPPQFGFRNITDAWMMHLYRLGRGEGFERSLTMRPELDSVEELLRGKDNPWTAQLAAWKLAGVEPYVVAGRPSPELLERERTEREARIAAETARLGKVYGARALQGYKEDYDKKSAELEELEGKVTLPPFTSTPPMTHDDQLKWEVRKVGPVELVASTFESMAATQVSLAFPLGVVAEEDLPYLALLPELLREVGIAGEGEVIPYDEMTERLRKEVLRLGLGVDVSARTGRAELIVLGAGNDVDETRRALGWVRRVLLAPDWRPENLPRLRDVAERASTELRSRMLGPEESWATGEGSPIESLREQRSPLYLHASSFLTRAHDAHRLRWMLEDAGKEQPAVVGYLDRLARAGSLPRARLAALTEALQRQPATVPADLKPYLAAFRALRPGARAMVGKAAADLGDIIGGVPDASLAADWAYLCKEIAADLARPPAEALAGLARVRALVVRAAGARAWSASSAASLEALAPDVAALVAKLDAAPAPRQSYGSRPQVAARASERLGRAVDPQYYGLLNPATGGGLYGASVPSASYDAADEERLLRALASSLYSGHGSHGIFMKTWAAGLAYSNGIRPSLPDGRLTYYAERTPRLPQTIRFVGDTLRRVTVDPRLAEYAVAQAFFTRSAETYEQRAGGLASDLADGIRPEVVRALREKLLALRSRPDLAKALFERLEPTVGQLLPGYGKPGEKVEGSVYLAVGPESQLSLFEGYLREVEGPATTFERIYPRDFWFPAKVK